MKYWTLLFLMIAINLFAQLPTNNDSLRKWQDGKLTINDFKVNETIGIDSLAMSYFFDVRTKVKRNDTIFQSHDCYAFLDTDYCFLKDSLSFNKKIKLYQLYFDYYKLLSLELEQGVLASKRPRKYLKEKIHNNYHEFEVYKEMSKGFDVPMIKSESNRINQLIENTPKIPKIRSYKISKFGVEFNYGLSLNTVILENKIKEYWHFERPTFLLGMKLRYKNWGLGVEEGFERFRADRNNEFNPVSGEIILFKIAPNICYKTNLTKSLSVVSQFDFGHQTYIFNNDGKKEEVIIQELGLSSIFFKPSLAFQLSLRKPKVNLFDKSLHSGFFYFKTGPTFIKFDNKFIPYWNFDFGFGFYFFKATPI